MLGLYFHHFQLCNLVPLQRYTKALSTLQRSSLVEKSRQKPQERMNVLSDVSVYSFILVAHVSFINCLLIGNR
jgi:hypothetical protein